VSSLELSQTIIYSFDTWKVHLILFSIHAITILLLILKNVHEENNYVVDNLAKQRVLKNIDLLA
jgi:hypothetical protein